MVTLQWDKSAERKVFKNIDDAFNNIIKGAEKGVLEGARHLRKSANDKYTPMDTTALVNTSQAISVTAKEPTAEVRYNEPYAVSVHEDMQKRHGLEYNEHYARQIALGIDHKRRDTEQAKFLERPLYEERFTIFNIIGHWVTI